MAKHSDSGKVDLGFHTKLASDIKVIGVREEEAAKLSNDKEMCSLVNRGAKMCTGFQMPLHYPRYKKEDYQRMDEERLDVLLKEYGLACDGSLEEKRAYAMGTFLWPDQL